MKKFYHQFKFLIGRFDRNEEGTSAVEYGILAAGIGAVVVTIINSLGGKVVAALTALDSGLGP